MLPVTRDVVHSYTQVYFVKEETRMKKCAHDI